MIILTDEGQSHTHTGTPCVPGAFGVLSTARKGNNKLLFFYQ